MSAPVIDFEDCTRCDGSGLIEAGQWPCPNCRGTGQVAVVAEDDYWPEQES